MLRRFTFLLSLVLTLALSACASDGEISPSTSSSRSAPLSKITECKSGDKWISDSSMCLQDDAACYQLADGGWCTGPRGLSCPTGSRALKQGEPCPPNAKCFSQGESLNCVIVLQ